MPYKYFPKSIVFMTHHHNSFLQFARERGIDSPTNKYLSLKSMSGSDDGLDRSGNNSVSGLT